jgi:hypothetical protein
MGFPPRVSIPDVVGFVVSRWTAAKAGAIASLWPAAPRWVSRYAGEMVVAHSQSLSRKTYHFAMGGRLMR